MDGWIGSLDRRANALELRPHLRWSRRPALRYRLVEDVDEAVSRSGRGGC